MRMAEPITTVIVPHRVGAAAPRRYGILAPIWRPLPARAGARREHAHVSLAASGSRDDLDLFAVLPGRLHRRRRADLLRGTPPAPRDRGAATGGARRAGRRHARRKAQHAHLPR